MQHNIAAFIANYTADDLQLHNCGCAIITNSS